MKTWIRLIVVTVLVVPMLLVVAPALAFDPEGPMAEEITIASIGDPYATALDKAIPEFTELTGIKVNQEVFDYDNGRKKQLLDASSGSNLYDIYSVDVPWVGEFDDPGYMESLDELIAAEAAAIVLDDYPQPVWDAHNWDGVQYQIPLATGAEMLFYRKDLFEADGIKVPETTQEFLDACKHFTKALNPDSPTEYGCAQNGQKGAAIAQQWMSWNSAFGGVPILEEDGKLVANMTSPEGIAAAEFMQAMLPTMPPNALELAWDSVFEEIAQGRVAMAPQWASRVFLIENPEKSAVAGKIGYALFPHDEGLLSRPGLGGYGMGINAGISDERKRAAWEFMKWLANPEGERMLVKYGDNAAANRYSSLADCEFQKFYPNWPVMLESYQRSNYNFRTRYPAYNTMSDALGVEISEMMLGSKTAAEALDAAQAVVAEELARME